MGEKWATNPPYPNWRASARDFTVYNSKTCSNDLARVNLTSLDQARQWVTNEMPRLVREGKVDRREQAICGMLIAQAVKRHPKSWGAICQLGAATDGEYTDFQKWESLVNNDERPMVKEVGALFAGLFTKPAGGTTHSPPTPK
jgi:hypothetical protein